MKAATVNLLKLNFTVLIEPSRKASGGLSLSKAKEYSLCTQRAGSEDDDDR